MPNNPLAALFSNADNSRSAIRAKQLEDPRNNRAFRGVVDQEDAVDQFYADRDPMVQKYRAIGDSQTEGEVFNQPEQVQMRDDRLKQILAPIALRNQGNLDVAQEMGGQRAFAAQQALDTRNAGLQQRSQQATAAEQGRNMRANDARLETQAKGIEKEGDGWGIMNFLKGTPPAAQRAAAVRAQQGGVSGGGRQTVADTDVASLAEQIRQNYPGKSFQDLIASGDLDLSEASPEEVNALLALE